MFRCRSGANLLLCCCRSQAVHHRHTNLSIWKTIGELIQDTSPGAGAQHMSPRSAPTQPQPRCERTVPQPHQRSEALAWSAAPSSGWMWRESGTTSKNKKQICLCPSRLPGIKRLSFQHWASRGLTQWRGRLFPFLNAKAAGTSLCHPCFLTWYPLKE